MKMDVDALGGSLNGKSFGWSESNENCIGRFGCGWADQPSWLRDFVLVLPERYISDSRSPFGIENFWYHYGRFSVDADGQLTGSFGFEYDEAALQAQFDTGSGRYLSDAFDLYTSSSGRWSVTSIPLPPALAPFGMALIVLAGRLLRRRQATSAAHAFGSPAHRAEGTQQHPHGRAR